MMHNNGDTRPGGRPHSTGSAALRRNAPVIYCALILCFVLMGIYYSFYGRIFLDAGFYLDAARRVMQGEMPYRDFFYVQGPVYPYIYGIPLMLTGPKVLYARWLSLMWGTLALILATRTAHRTGGGIPGAVIAL
nr:hypothetical protein [bacterium]